MTPAELKLEKASLQMQVALLEEQYKALENKRIYENNPVRRVNFEKQATELLVEYDKKQTELEQVTKKLMQLDEDQAGKLISPQPQNRLYLRREEQTGKFFFSYARADSEFVLKLAEDLRSIGTNLWLDQLDIKGGTRWDDAVEEALHAAPCLLVVLSPASVTSDNVKDEISFGIDNRKRIVPILYKECAIPLRLKRFQYIDFRVDYDDGFKRLLQKI